MIQQALAAAREAARQAGSLMRQGLTQTRQIQHKSRFDLVTDVDHRCEQVILEVLSRTHPKAILVAEESTAGADADAAEVWLIDPLDGTNNYAHQFPMFCCSLAYLRDGVAELGLVFDPLRDERFEAIRGQGASLNGRPIRASQTNDLSQALLATGFPADRTEQGLTNLDRFAAMTMRTQGVRRSGSAALDLCYTACGRLDGYWEFRIHAWDVAAGALMVSEAGGRISRCDGEPFDRSGLDTLASNGILHEALIASLAEPLPPGPAYG